MSTDSADPRKMMGVTVRVCGGGGRGMALLRAGREEDCWWTEGEREREELGQDAVGFPGKWSSHESALGLKRQRKLLLPPANISPSELNGDEWILPRPLKV